MKPVTSQRQPQIQLSTKRQSIKTLNLLVLGVTAVALLTPLLLQLVFMGSISWAHLLPAMIAPLATVAVLYAIIRHWISTHSYLANIREQLHQSEHLYQTIITTMAEGVVYHDADGHIRTCNAAAEKILGLTHDQITGRTSTDPRWYAVHEDGSPFPGDQHPAMVTLRTGAPQRNIIMGVHKPAGTLKWINICTEPIFDDHNPTCLSGVIATFTEITALIEQQRQFRALFDNNHDAIFLLDLEGTHIAANTRAHQLLGYAPGELIGLGRKDIVAAEDWDDGDTMLNIARAGKALPLYERTFLRKDGSRLHMEVSVQLIRDVEGKPLYIQSIARDISERKRSTALLVEKQRFIESIAELSPTMIAVHEMNSNRFIYVNRAVETFTNRTFSQIFLENNNNLLNICPEDQAAFDAYIAQLFAMQIGEVATAECRVMNGAGEWRWLWLRSVRMQLAANVADDQILHIALDITERKATEQAALDLALERERIGLINHFIRDVSHEFRTPLAIINTTTYLLQRFEDPQQRSAAAGRITQQVDLINRLVDSLVLLSELESTQLTRQTVNLSALLNDLLAKYTPRWQANDLTIAPRLVSPLNVCGDPNLLLTALDNLLDNAGRYTPKGGIVEISTSITQDVVTLSFFNSDTSLTPELLPRIFERFYRQDDAHTTAGLGLGLPIARKILELHQGSLDAELEPAHGVRFKLTLPLLSVQR